MSLLRVKAKACCCEGRCEYYFTPCEDCPGAVDIGPFAVPCQFFDGEPSTQVVYVFEGECFQYSPAWIPHATILSQFPEGTFETCLDCCPPPPTGACCIDPESALCINDLTESQCDTAGGTWYEGQECAGLGELCQPEVTIENCSEVEEGDCPAFIFVTLPEIAIVSGPTPDCVCGTPACTVMLELVTPDGLPPTYTSPTYPNPGCFFDPGSTCPCCFEDGNLALWNGEIVIRCVTLQQSSPCPEQEPPYWELTAVADIGLTGNVICIWRMDTVCPLGVWDPCHVDNQSFCQIDENALSLVVQ